MKNFLKENWFKISALILLLLFILVLNTGIDINHNGYIDHRGYIESNYDAIDGSTIWSNFYDIRY